MARRLGDSVRQFLGRLTEMPLALIRSVQCCYFFLHLLILCLAILFLAKLDINNLTN